MREEIDILQKSSVVFLMAILVQGVRVGQNSWLVTVHQSMVAFFEECCMSTRLRSAEIRGVLDEICTRFCLVNGGGGGGGGVGGSVVELLRVGDSEGCE